VDGKQVVEDMEVEVRSGIYGIYLTSDIPKSL